MNIVDIKKVTDDKMKKCLENLKTAFSKIRTGRAHTGLIEHIHIDYLGNRTPITQVANLNILDARTIGVQVWEKNIQPLVEKAIRESGLGLNPSSNGGIIRVPMPALTEERRKDISKVVRSEGEEGKIGIRNARRDANDLLKKSNQQKIITEDDEKRTQNEIQKFTDKYIQEIDKIVSDKEKEIMTL